MSSNFIKSENNQIEIFLSEENKRWSDEYSFVFLADPQPGLIDVIENEGKGSVWNKEIELMNKVCNEINKIEPQPEFVVIGGDIINESPGNREEVRLQQVADVKAAFSNLKPNIPVLSVSGNHDVGNAPDKNSIQWYKNHFGDDFYSYWYRGVFYIVINSQLVYDPQCYPEYSTKQQEWLDEQLKFAKSSSANHTILFMHIPMFVEDSQEQDQYFNIPKTTREQLLLKFSDAGISKIFCGHFHRNAGGLWTSEKDPSKKIEVVVSSAVGCQLGPDKPGYRIVNVKNNQITHQYFSVE